MLGSGVNVGMFAPFALRALRSFLAIGSTLILSAVGAKLVWLLVAGPGSFYSEAPGRRANNVDGGRTLDTSVLMRVTPFRLSAPSQIEDAPVEADTPETELELVLNGIITDVGGEGAAFITGDDGQQYRYSRGDEIKGMKDVVVDGIYADGVILQRQGRVERLTTYGDDSDRAITQFDPEITQSSDVQLDEQLNVAAKTSGVEEPSGENTDISSREAAEVAKASARLTRAEMLDFLQWARIDVLTENGQSGVTVFPTNAVIFQRSGLHARDIVQSIGGVALSEDMDYARLLDDIKEQDLVEIQLIRNNKPIQLVIRLTED